jgi:hypothetical protein
MGSRAARAHLEQLQHLADDARTRLVNASPHQHRRIYELLHLSITLAPDHTLETTAPSPPATPSTRTPTANSQQKPLRTPDRAAVRVS